MIRLSVIVPTRERSDTLVHTIRTLTSQDFRDCEIVISDNASLDNTAEVVRSFSDPRLRYVNTGRRVSMSDNWEFALRESKGEFVTYIGDDDGFIPGSLTKAMRLIEGANADALAWERAAYNWPDHTLEGMGNWLSLRTSSTHVYLVDSQKQMQKLLRFRDGFAYARLPGVYHGIVRRGIIDKVRNYSPKGIFFDSISPDVYSSIAIGKVLKSYLLSEYPFSVLGCSRHSIGTSYGTGKAKQPDSAAARFASELSYEFDPRIKIGPAVETAVLGEYMLMRRSLPALNLPEPPWDRYVRALIRRAKVSPCADDILASASHTVEKVGLKIRVPDRIPGNGSVPPVPGMAGDVLKFKAPVELISNIYDACRLVEGMLPDASRGSAMTALVRFIRNMNRCLISEAKTLYRAL